MIAETSPWIAGGAAGFFVAAGNRSDRKSTLLMVGAYSYIGILTCATILWCGAKFGFNSLSKVHYYSWMTLGATLVAAACYRHGKANIPIVADRATGYGAVIVLAASIITLAAMSYMAILIPVSAWDVLQGGEWGTPSFGERAVQFIQRSTGSVESSFQYEYRHPMTNFLLLAWGSMSQEVIGGSGIQILWLCMLISTALVAGGYAFMVTESRFLAAINIWLMFTLPLLGNHALLAGYNEILLVSSVVCTAAILSIALKSGSKFYFALGLIFWLSILATKSIGIAHWILTAAAIFLSYLSVHSKPVLLAFTLLSPVLIVLLALQGFNLDFLSFRFSWSPDSHMISFAGRTLEITSNSLSSIASNFFYSTVANTSFSAIIVLGVLVAHQLLTDRHMEYATSVRFIVLTFLLGILFLAAIQLTPYGFATASPTTDTLFSRISLASYCVVFLLVPHLAMALSRETGNAAMPAS